MTNIRRSLPESLGDVSEHYQAQAWSEGTRSDPPAPLRPDGQFWSAMVAGRLQIESLRMLDGSDASNFNYTRNIWRLNADGTSLMPLTTATATGVDADWPHFSPDGSKVVFQSTRNLDGSDVGLRGRE